MTSALLIASQGSGPLLAHPKADGLVDELEIALVGPVASGDSQVADFRTELGQGRVPARSARPFSEAATELGVVGGVRYVGFNTPLTRGYARTNSPVRWAVGHMLVSRPAAFRGPWRGHVRLSHGNLVVDQGRASSDATAYLRGPSRSLWSFVSRL